jgi:DNA-binding transcriptional MerR regulator
MDKADGAFLTIGELARDLGVAQHILRYWESRFPQLRPLQRSGNRRYYRPADVEVARRIHRLLNEEGFTVRGAQRVLDGAEDESGADVDLAHPAGAPIAPPVAAASGAGMSAQSELALGGERPAPAPRRQFDSSDIALLIARLTVIRENLREAIGVS